MSNRVCGCTEGRVQWQMCAGEFHKVHESSLKPEIDSLNAGCGNVQGDILYESTPHSHSLTYEFGLCKDHSFLLPVHFAFFAKCQKTRRQHH